MSHNTQAYVSARSSGGCNVHRTIDLDQTGQLIKAGAGTVYGYYLSNVATVARFVRFYDKVTAPLSSDTPVMTIVLPASSAANVYWGPGVKFTAGIGARATTAVADADTGAPAANDIVANILYA